MASNPHGSDHWRAQRLTAIALFPLCLWFLSSLLVYSPSDYTAIIEWLKSPLTATGMVLLIGLLLYHAQLGIQVVIEDYIHQSCFKAGLIYIVKGAALSLFVFACFCILKIHFHPL